MNLPHNPPPLVLTSDDAVTMTVNSIEGEQMVNAPYSPAVFGPSAWFILHRAAARTNMDEEFFSWPEARKTFGDLLSNLYTMIPCEICSEHTSKYMNMYISKRDPTSSDILLNNHTLSLFLYTFHTSVNENYAINKDTYVRPSYQDAIIKRFETEIPLGCSTTLDYDQDKSITRAVFFFLFNGAAKVSPSIPVKSQMGTGQMVVTQKFLNNQILEDLVDFFKSCWVLFPCHTKSRKIVRHTVSNMTRAQLKQKLSPRTGAFMFVYELYANSDVSKNLKRETVLRIASRFGIIIESLQTLRDNLSW